MRRSLSTDSRRRAASHLAAAARPLAWLSLGLALSACSGEEKKGAEYPEYAFSNQPCITVVERMEHLDEASGLGFSAVEVLARVVGASDSTLIWLPPQAGDAYLLDYGPEHGTSNVRVQITAAEGPVRYRHEVLTYFAQEDTVCSAGALEIPVTVSIQSADHALDETFNTRLEASVPYRAHISRRFAPGGMDGGLVLSKLESLDPARTFAPGELTLEVELWEGGSQGSLHTEVRASYSKDTQITWPPATAGEPPALAVWPSAESCAEAGNQLPSNAKVVGFSVQDVLRTLAGERARELAWSTGVTTDLEFEFATPPGELCQSVAEQSLGFESSVRVRTSDGKLDIELPVQISAHSRGGSVGDVSVQTKNPEEPLAGGSLAASVLRELESLGYSGARINLDASFHVGGSAGTITLSGVDAKDASSALPHELASGRWSQ
ncbi:MAG TPA: hypothetical protein VJU61_11800 [Polyangiaceae bacterium]|nr:hypothetical protein [Polyangiaceae bacterium]